MKIILLVAAFSALLVSAASAGEPTVNHKLEKRSKSVRKVPKSEEQKKASAESEAEPQADPKILVNPNAAELSSRAEEGVAKGGLGSLRAGSSIFYGDTEGTYPATLSALVPKYVDKIPAISVGGHKKTDAVRIVTKAKGKSAGPYVKDTGGWLYFVTPENNDLHGTIVIDCAHGDHKNRPLWGF